MPYPPKSDESALASTNLTSNNRNMNYNQHGYQQQYGDHRGQGNNVRFQMELNPYGRNAQDGQGEFDTRCANSNIVELGMQGSNLGDILTKEMAETIEVTGIVTGKITDVMTIEMVV